MRRLTLNTPPMPRLSGRANSVRWSSASLYLAAAPGFTLKMSCRTERHALVPAYWPAWIPAHRRALSGHITPPRRQPRSKLIVSSVNSHTNATRIGWHTWEIDFRFAPGLHPGWFMVDIIRAIWSLSHADNASEGTTREPQALASRVHVPFGTLWGCSLMGKTATKSWGSVHGERGSPTTPHDDRVPVSV